MAENTWENWVFFHFHPCKWSYTPLLISCCWPHFGRTAMEYTPEDLHGMGDFQVPLFVFWGVFCPSPL